MNVELYFAYTGPDLLLHQVIREHSREDPRASYTTWFGEGFWKDGGQERTVRVLSIPYPPEGDEPFLRYDTAKRLAKKIRDRFGEPVTIQTSHHATLVIRD